MVATSQVRIIGGGGHCKVVIDILKKSSERINGIFDDQLPKNSMINGIPVLGPISMLETDDDSHLSYRYICAIGDNRARERIVSQLRKLTENSLWATATHPTAVISDHNVQIGQGTMICAGTIIQPDSTIGSHVIINTGAQIDHDCQVDEYAHVCPGSILCGTVNVGRLTVIGAGSVVINNCSIGAGTIVGSGSNVVRNLPHAAVAYGNPCRVIKQITKYQS